MTVFDCLDPVTRRDGMDAATTAARGGRLVVLPTDTVYGIGADAFSPHAVRDLLTAKGRGPDMPVPVLIGSTATLAGLVVGVPPRARLLMDAFWPGGLSLILEHASSLSWNLGDTRNTVMVRMPLHPVALELLRAVGPMAVSSANISGRPPATTAEQAQSQLADSVAVYLDAGPSPVGVASTVVDLTGEVPMIRRIGAVSVEQLRAVLPEIEVPAELLATVDPQPADPTSAKTEYAEPESVEPESAEPESAQRSSANTQPSDPGTADPDPADTVGGSETPGGATEPVTDGAPAGDRPAPDAAAEPRPAEGDPAADPDSALAQATMLSGHESTDGTTTAAQGADAGPFGPHPERRSADS